MLRCVRLSVQRTSTIWQVCGHPAWGGHVSLGRQVSPSMDPALHLAIEALLQRTAFLCKPEQVQPHWCLWLSLLVMPGAGSVAVFTVSSSFSSLWHPLPTVTLCDGKLLVLICFFFTALKKHQRCFVVLRCHLVGIAMRFPTLCFFLTSRFSERRQWSLERNCYLLSTLPLGYRGHCLILRGKTTYFWWLQHIK